MARTRTLRPLTTALLAACIALPAYAAENAAQAPAHSFVPDRPRAQSLSGAYLAGRSAQREGDLGAAASFYGQALSIDPDSVDLQRDAMFAYLADGSIDEAAALADKLVDSPDAGKVARMTKGVTALRDGDYDAARQALELEDPSELDTLLAEQLKAWAVLGDGRVDAALSSMDQLDEAPWFAVFSQYAKGLMAIEADRTSVAEKTLGQVVEDPSLARTSPDAYLASVDALARTQARAGKTDAALATADAGLAIASGFEPVQQLRERIADGETVEPAIGSIQEGAAESLYILGQAINRGEGQRVAQLYFQLARSLAPKNPAVLTALAGIAEETDHLDRAVDLYREIPKDSAYRRTAELQIGLDLWRADRKDEAKAHLEQAIEAYPDDIQAYTAYADVLSAAKDYDRMAEVLDKAIALAKKQGAENWRQYYRRGIAFERTDRWPQAEADLKKSLEMSPRQADVLNYLGYSWVDQNRNLDRGLEMIKTAVELKPNDGYIIDSLGWAFYRLGRFDEAVDELERAVLITPMDPTINDHLGDAYWRVGRKREARFQWNRALEGTPEPEPDRAEEIRAKLQNGLDPVEDDDTQVGSKSADERRANAGNANRESGSSSGGSQANSPTADD